MVTEESAKETVKTIAQGMPADAVYPWLLTRVLFYAHAASGAARIRHSLRPLISRREGFGHTSGGSRRENAVVYPRGYSKIEAHRSSSPAKAGDPVFQRRRR
jgi:hypothetical protein